MCSVSQGDQGLRGPVGNPGKEGPKVKSDYEIIDRAFTIIHLTQAIDIISRVYTESCINQIHPACRKTDMREE